MKAKRIRILRAEVTGKHYKGPKWEGAYYRIPIRYYLADGTVRDHYVSGSRLKDAKDYAERLCSQYGCIGRYIEDAGNYFSIIYDHGEWMEFANGDKHPDEWFQAEKEGV
mgnify:CR=1 FL=1